MTTNAHEYDRRDPNHPLRRTQDYRPDGTRVRRWSTPERKYRLTYRSHPLITLIVTALVVVVPAGIAVGGTTINTATHVPEGKRAQAEEIDWSWSDGGSNSSREFLSSSYKSASALPTIEVQVSPGQTGLLYVEFQQDGEWDAEWVGKPDASGKLTVPVDPYCENKSWCDGTYKYRLKMPGLTSYFEIAYWDR